MHVVGMVCAILVYLVILIGGVSLVVSGLREGYRSGPVFGGLVLLFLATFGVFFTLDSNLDDRTQVCAVLERRTWTTTSREGGQTTYRRVLTRDCGTLRVESAELYDGLKPGYSYRLRCRGGRWITDPTAYRNDGRVLR